VVIAHAHARRWAHDTYDLKDDPRGGGPSLGDVRERIDGRVGQ
jgi:hypothetical protein